jgi:uncharacterized protein YcaQ
VLELSAAEARMLVLSGLGLRGGVTTAKDDSQRIKDVVSRLGYIQLDSVNVFERAHYLPLFSRLGNYDRSAFQALQEPGTDGYPHLVEYWAHEASLVEVEDLPLFKFRMDRIRLEPRLRWRSWVDANKDLVEWILAEVRDRGPLTIRDIEHDRNKRKGTWWGWSDVKTGLEWLFHIGAVTSGGRDGFSRVYATPEQVLPPHIVDALQPRETAYVDAHYHEARLALIEKAASALRVATWDELADYFRQQPTHTRHWVGEMVESGRLVEARVEGWNKPAYLSREAVAELEVAPPGTNPTTILSPFDHLTWNRERAQRLFDFDYKIEIYVPQEKRVYGYYTLPILHNRRIVGRIDLKSDRQNSVLISQAAWVEEWLSPSQIESVAAGLAKNLKLAQQWQGLAQIRVEPVGTLSAALAANF